jgi:hypothetical protein
MQLLLSSSTVLTSRTMEQWQFLIQKQGDRAWQSLESPSVEILEGRYRVVARTASANTDVEVRVTHLSQQENPPRRRIHKRSRRTNVEGLMAVIPFTYFAVGEWELRCSGDLMSDILGRSWHQTLRLQVLPISSVTEATTPANDDTGTIEGFVDLMPSLFTASLTNESETPASLSPTSPITPASIPVPPVPPNFTQITVKNTSFEGSEPGLVSDDDANRKLPVISANDAITLETPTNEEKIIERIVIDSVPVLIIDVEPEVNINEPVTATTTYRAPLETLSQANMLDHLTVSEVGELQPLLGAQLDEITIQSNQVTTNAIEPIETELPISDSCKTLTEHNEAIDELTVIALSDNVTLTEHNEAIDELPVIASSDDVITEIESNQNHQQDITDATIDEPISLNTSNLTVYIRQNQGTETISNQSISPVWVKGDTAEQILHNLIELALPPSEPLLAEDANKESQIDNVPLPLLLTLDEQAYIARWGRPLTIYGRAQLTPTHTDVNDDTAEFESVLNGELRIKLLEPQGLEVLTQVQQSLSEKLLPFGFEFTVEIPANSQSKLLLADISLYGSLGGVENPVLLATQSFIITADVTELLAVSATAKPSEPDMLDYPLAALTPEPEPVVSLDLELFNLVKTAKTAEAKVFQPSPKRVLPLTVEPRKRKQGSTRKLQLPFSQGQEEITAFTEIDKSSTSLPFLKKRLVHPVEEVTSSIVDNNLEGFDSDTLATVIDVDSPNPVTLAPELVTDVLTQDDYVENDGDVIPDNSLTEVIPPPPPQSPTLNRSQVSPLIQKWMQSQGYSLSETINLQYSSLDIPNNVNAVGEETLDNDNMVPIVNPEDLTVVQSEPVESPIDLEVQLPVFANVTTPPPRFAQEIVIDDTFNFINTDVVSAISLEPEAQTLIDNLLNSLPSPAENTEPLPIPKLNLPTGDLISGRTIRVKVLLPDVSPQIALKLWVEDCQTRWLLEGPHLLTDLFPSPNGQGMEAQAELNIPFGCLEIRIEAISFNLATQQESHKATIHRTVIPPDLPTLQLDELLGI